MTGSTTDLAAWAATASQASATLLGEVARLAVAGYDAAVLADLEDLPAERDPSGGPAIWRDTRPWLDEREHAPQVIDMARNALAYAALRGLIQRHPDRGYMVTIIRRGGG